MSTTRLADTIFRFANYEEVSRATLGFDVLTWTVDTIVSKRADKSCRLHAPPDDCWREPRDVETQQEKLRALLHRMADRGVTAPLWRTLRERANNGLEASAEVWIARSVGRVEGTLDIYPATIEAWYCFGLAELIAAGLGDAVRVCEKSGCSVLFLAANRSGRPRRYCSSSHASQDRVARKREKDKRRRRIL